MLEIWIASRLGTQSYRNRSWCHSTGLWVNIFDRDIHEYLWSNRKKITRVNKILLFSLLQLFNRSQNCLEQYCIFKWNRPEKLSFCFYFSQRTTSQTFCKPDLSTKTYSSFSSTSTSQKHWVLCMLLKALISHVFFFVFYGGLCRILDSETPVVFWGGLCMCVSRGLM